MKLLVAVKDSDPDSIFLNLSFHLCNLGRIIRPEWLWRLNGNPYKELNTVAWSIVNTQEMVAIPKMIMTPIGNHGFS